MSFDMPGLTARVRRLYFRKAERLTLNLFGRDMHRVGPTSSGTRGTSKPERTYGLQRGTTAGFPSALLQSILSNFSAHDLVKRMTGHTLVQRSLSQDDLESMMRVSVGPDGHKRDMRNTRIAIERAVVNMLLAFGTDNIVAQPVAAKSVYRQEEQANEDEWDNGTAVKPPLGGFTGGQPDKEKKAAKSAEGKAAFRLAQFKNVVLVGDGP
jgi:hypothetical protein